MKGTAKVTAYFDKECYSFEDAKQEANDYAVRACHGRALTPEVMLYPTEAREMDQMHTVETVIACDDIDAIVESLRRAYPFPCDDIYPECHIRRVEVEYVID